MSEWITDRQPTAEDGFAGDVWITDLDGELSQRYFAHVALGRPWQPIHKPAPYVKPKRWVLQWSDDFNKWIIKDIENGHWQSLAFLSEDDIDAAQRILDIYNEVKP